LIDIYACVVLTCTFIFTKPFFNPLTILLCPKEVNQVMVARGRGYERSPYVLSFTFLFQATFSLEEVSDLSWFW
jgi:hypothetical protein